MTLTGNSINTQTEEEEEKQMTLTNDEKFALLQDMKVIDNNRKIVELVKKRKEFYVDDLHKCNEQGLHGKSLHYESIIEELNLLLGHKHNWKYFGDIKYCKSCGIYKTMSDKEQQKILEGETND